MNDSKQLFEREATILISVSLLYQHTGNIAADLRALLHQLLHTHQRRIRPFGIQALAFRIWQTFWKVSAIVDSQRVCVVIGIHSVCVNMNAQCE